ncbi:putative nucleic acid-binding protein [Pseudomonas sp. BIGb0408]|uniref:Putative nucleic acid-binding protein n=1 Tax=Phytopseudomonas flavescens TaxID=29435 RepID=A0A7Y9XNH2_9GAMM|nr:MULTISPECIES: PIN-like domain-containing protein [Pseudomonas]MCW2290807.1 putative nucleic acid-binding protein [Pseudomonas sp. BIGb0408]NYH74621.1 putative nucleic acid-binding protein [Pseudomonas flavescens]
MLLGLNLLKKTKDDFLTDLAYLAKSKDTLIFIDTNILSYLFKLHSAARQEFFDWAVGAIGEERLYLPAWCAGEYLAKVRENLLHTYTPKGKGDDQPRKALEAMLDTASLFVDDAVLRATSYAGTRTDYLTGFREAIDGLKQYTRAFKHQFDPDEIHAEIQEYLGTAVLESPLAKLCERAAKEGPARIEHRLPPGFRDEGKPENRLGDLIIWLELLEYSAERRADFTHVLFLTNDEKSDWVYAPSKRLDITRAGLRPVPNINPRLKIIDPRLVSEFRQIVGHSEVSICSLSSLVQGISKTDPTIIAQLAAAIQIDLGGSEGLPADIEMPVQAEPHAEPEAEPDTALGAVSAANAQAEPEIDVQDADVDQGKPNNLPAQPGQAVHDLPDEIAAAIQLEGYRDAAYETDAPGQLNDIISSLKSHNWYIQNPAIEKIKSILSEDFPPTSWFVLGRNIYQAACGNAQKAMDFMVNLDTRLKRFPEQVSTYILAGMTYEIYFNSQGALRDSPKAGYLAKPLALLAKDEYSDVRAFIRSKLEQAGAHLYFYPGDDRKRTVVVQSHPSETDDILDADKRRRLSSITIDGRQILVDVQPENDELLTRYRASYSATDILDDISATLSIPRWALTLQLAPEVDTSVRFVIPDDRWFTPRIAGEADGAGGAA